MIISEYDHSLLQSLAERTSIFKMGSDVRNLGRIELSFSSGGKLESLDWEIIPVTHSMPENAQTAAVVATA